MQEPPAGGPASTGSGPHRLEASRTTLATRERANATARRGGPSPRRRAPTRRRMGGQSTPLGRAQGSPTRERPPPCPTAQPLARTASVAPSRGEKGTQHAKQANAETQPPPHANSETQPPPRPTARSRTNGTAPTGTGAHPRGPAPEWASPLTRGWHARERHTTWRRRPRTPTRGDSQASKPPSQPVSAPAPYPPGVAGGAQAAGRKAGGKCRPRSNSCRGG